MYRINEKRLVKTFVDMAKISSPSWHEGGMIDYMTGAARKAGLKVRKFPCGGSHNLLLQLSGDEKKRPVLFSAHMDTVTPCDRVRPVVSHTKITSDGTTILGSDDKAAIAMFLEAARYIQETGMPHLPVEILVTCAEEVGLKGAKCFDMSLLRSRYAFVFDCDGPVGKIVLQAPYQSTIGISVTGRAAHAGMEPEKGINAINVLSEIITRLPSGRVDHETTMNVGTVSCGRANNIVAENASCLLETRSLDRNKLKKQESLIRSTAKETATRLGARCTVKSELEYSGFIIHPSDTVPRIAVGAMERAGIRHHFEVSGGGSDTNIFNRAGIKAINLSAGMRNVHTPKEYIMIRDLVNGAKVAISIIDSTR
ncbi:MAG: M20/M25/M40 family metallo-hydrolase [Chrysiogenales bacterium]|nr:MAG: M20/M25/M40 family metallo-hydrolase [Chrysiogenales bacterium]